MWNSCRSSDRRKIERVQERALRAVFKSTAETCEELLERAKLPMLYNRRLQDVATLMYKVKNNLAPSCESEIFTRKDNRYQLRNRDFETPRFNTICYGKHSIRYQGPLIWSKLDRKTRELPSLHSFKANIHKIDLASQLDNNSNCCNLCNM